VKEMRPPRKRLRGPQNGPRKAAEKRQEEQEE
jgi:hypothetical protein